LPLADDHADKDPEFPFVLAYQGIQVAKEQNTILFDIPNTVLEYHSDECSFDARIRKYGLDKKEKHW
jgi:hypothetical protein